MNVLNARPCPAQRGFSLIEVLVALLVLAIGVLGMAALMSNSVRNNQSAFFRTQALVLATEMADRIRSNPDADYINTAAADSDDCVALAIADGGCGGPGPLAAFDRFEWNAALAATLAGGVGVVCRDASLNDGTPAAPACDGNADSPLVVKVWWDDDRSGAIDARDPRIALVVAP